ncbi:hypothetical protein JTE90_009676, partial [Oedothorax gibbosus]
MVMHNAPFDVKFLNHELALLKRDPLKSNLVVDTLVWPGKGFREYPTTWTRCVNDSTSTRQNPNASRSSERRPMLAKVYRKMTDEHRTPPGVAAICVEHRTTGNYRPTGNPNHP